MAVRKRIGGRCGNKASSGDCFGGGGFAAGALRLADHEFRVGHRDAIALQVEAHVCRVLLARNEFEAVAGMDELAQAREGDALQRKRTACLPQGVCRQRKLGYAGKNRAPREMSFEPGATRGHFDDWVHARFATIAAMMKLG